MARISAAGAYVSNLNSALYVVATPIGNLDDMTPRAVRVLSHVDLIAAEDTRHSGKLLRHFGITTKMTAFHEHNERNQVPRLIKILRTGKSIALISDAGTPLLNDPGFHLVRAARAADIRIVPIPGACAAVAALSAAGLPSDRFTFEGFPPARRAARRTYFRERARERRTLIFYESPHRIIESLDDMAAEFGAMRPAAIARELTKQFETIRLGGLAELRDWLSQDQNRRLGEFVVLVHGAEKEAMHEMDPDAERILRILMRDLPLSEAAALAAEITGLKKNRLYQRALDLQGKPSRSPGTG